MNRSNNTTKSTPSAQILVSNSQLKGARVPTEMADSRAGQGTQMVSLEDPVLPKVREQSEKQNTGECQRDTGAC